MNGKEFLTAEGAGERQKKYILGCSKRLLLMRMLSKRSVDFCNDKIECPSALSALSALSAPSAVIFLNIPRRRENYVACRQ